MYIKPCNARLVTEACHGIAKGAWRKIKNVEKVACKTWFRCDIVTLYLAG